MYKFIHKPTMEEYTDPITNFLRVMSKYPGNHLVESIEKVKLEAISNSLRRKLEEQNDIISAWISDSYVDNEDELDESLDINDVIKKIIQKTPHSMINCNVKLSEEEVNSVLGESEYIEYFVELFGKNPEYCSTLMQTSWCKSRYESMWDMMSVEDILKCAMSMNFYNIKALRFGKDETPCSEEERSLYIDGIKKNTIITSNPLGCETYCKEFLSKHAPWWGNVPHANITGSIIPAIMNNENSRNMYAPTYYDLSGKDKDTKLVKNIILVKKFDQLEVVGFFFPKRSNSLNLENLDSTYIGLTDDVPPIKFTHVITPMAYIKVTGYRNMLKKKKNRKSRLIAMKQYINKQVFSSDSDSEDIDSESEHSVVEIVGEQQTNDDSDSEHSVVEIVGEQQTNDDTDESDTEESVDDGTGGEKFVLINIIPGTDIDCTVWSEDNVESVALGIYKFMSEKYPGSMKIEKVERSKGVAFNVSMDFRIPEGLSKEETKAFAFAYLNTYPVEVYNTTIHHVFTHHVNMTRAYISSEIDTDGNKQNIWNICPSCLYSIYTYRSTNYYYFAGKKSSVCDILSKYMFRGFELPRYLASVEHLILEYMETKLKIPYGYLP